MDYRNLSYESRGAIGVLTLNRPDKLNAISLEFANELNTFFAELRRNLQTRVIIVRNEGQVFSAGIDLQDVGKVMEGATSESGLGKMQYGYRFGQIYQEIVMNMRQAPQPLIAAIRGPAVGAGFSLAMACDVRIAGESARFSAAFVRVGLSGGDMGSSYFLPRLIGLSRAAEYLFTGRFIEATTAERIGLVSRIVPDNEVDAAALGLAEEMLQVSPFGLRMTKEVLNLNPQCQVRPWSSDQASWELPRLRTHI